MLSTTGNWGSTVWDMTDTMYIVVCDTCIQAKFNNLVIETTTKIKSEIVLGKDYRR